MPKGTIIGRIENNMIVLPNGITLVSDADFLKLACKVKRTEIKAALEQQNVNS